VLSGDLLLVAAFGGFKVDGNTGIVIAGIEQSTAAAYEFAILFAQHRLMVQQFHSALLGLMQISLAGFWVWPAFL
jgi:hypothetical protein